MARKRKAAKKSNKASVARTRVLRKRLTALIANANKAQAAARKALAKLGRQGAAASGPILGGLQKAWRELDVAVRAGAKRFRETP